MSRAMKRAVQVLVLLAVVCVAVCSACRRPTAPPAKKDPYTDHQACLDAGGQWGPWATHYGCKFPGKAA